MYDVSAAPTTYAMSYRPYEVEDQDNLQRGRVAEYLIAAQDALRDRLADLAAQGHTSPTAAWQADFDRMRQWRSQAGALFRNGDHLHAEYAARNAAIAAQGIPQTKANTSKPKLLEAGQVFYFEVNPQGGTDVAVADPAPTDLTATQAKPKETVLEAVVENQGDADAPGVRVPGRGRRHRDLRAGEHPRWRGDVSVTWDTRSVKGTTS